jgi:hypothetical protein
MTNIAPKVSLSLHICMKKFFQKKLKYDPYFATNEQVANILTKAFMINKNEIKYNTISIIRLMMLIHFIKNL